MIRRWCAPRSPWKSPSWALPSSATSTASVAPPTWRSRPKPPSSTCWATPTTSRPWWSMPTPANRQTCYATASRRVIPDDAEALTGDEITAEQKADLQSDFIGFLEMFLLAFAGIAMLVATFSIHNTFSILVAQRTRESALLRALGASRRQIVGSVAFEALAVGAVASGVGLVAGAGIAYGLKALMASFGLRCRWPASWSRPTRSSSRPPSGSSSHWRPAWFRHSRHHASPPSPRCATSRSTAPACRRHARPSVCCWPARVLPRRSRRRAAPMERLAALVWVRCC